MSESFQRDTWGLFSKGIELAKGGTHEDNRKVPH
jgi:hypothetical protein